MDLSERHEGGPQMFNGIGLSREDIDSPHLCNPIRRSWLSAA